jgi:hypothetical protein
MLKWGTRSAYYGALKKSFPAPEFLRKEQRTFVHVKSFLVFVLCDLVSKISNFPAGESGSRL